MVSHTVLLDAGPLGLVTNPRRSRQSVACAQWLQELVGHESRVLVPEVADYEVRRELLRANKTRGLARLDALAAQLEYLPLTTAAMRQAAVFWAQARQQGRPKPLIPSVASVEEGQPNDTDEAYTGNSGGRKGDRAS